jgi:hypothetical protein
MNVVGISHGGVVACAVAGGRHDDAVGGAYLHYRACAQLDFGGVQCNGRFVVQMEGGGTRRVRYRLRWPKVCYVTLSMGLDTLTCVCPSNRTAQRCLLNLSSIDWLDFRARWATRYRISGCLGSHSRELSWTEDQCSKQEDLSAGERFRTRECGFTAVSAAFQESVSLLLTHHVAHPAEVRATHS